MLASLLTMTVARNSGGLDALDVVIYDEYLCKNKVGPLRGSDLAWRFTSNDALIGLGCLENID